VKNLTPKDKAVNVFLWTGDCNPDTDALAVAEDAGILAMNGGDTVITKENPSWTAIAPIGVQKESYFQIYAPNQNENLYTDLWTKRFYGFERVIETFEMTNRPYRFKPINIYHHMYSATKLASLNALKKVYNYALKQDVIAFYASEYIKAARDFNRIAIGKTSKGYLIAGNDAIREFRIPKTTGYPNLDGSVIGFSDHEQDRYIHLAPLRKHEITLAQTSRQKQAYIESVNAAIVTWNPTQKGINFTIQSHQPVVTMRLGNMQGCTIRINDKAHPMRMVGNGIAAVEIKGKADVLQKISVRCAD
jgi:hypothetical protein